MWDVSGMLKDTVCVCMCACEHTQLCRREVLGMAIFQAERTSFAKVQKHGKACETPGQFIWLFIRSLRPYGCGRISACKAQEGAHLEMPFMRHDGARCWMIDAGVHSRISIGRTTQSDVLFRKIILKA